MINHLKGVVRKILLGCLLAGVAGMGWAEGAAIPAAPTHHVTDTVGLLSDAKKADLEAQLQDFERRTTGQVLVWIGDSTKGVPLESWTNDAFKAWKVGQKDRNNGLVLFYFKSDDRFRFEVGYGYEGVFPDNRAKHILADIMRPVLAQGKPDAAFALGVSTTLQALGDGGQSASVKADRPARHPDTLQAWLARRSPLQLLGLLVLAILVLVLLGGTGLLGIVLDLVGLDIRSGGSGGWGGGGGGDSGGGGASE